MDKLILFVTYLAKEGKGKTFVDEVVTSGLRGKILKENGCIRYDYYFSAINKDEVFLLEIWDSENAQKEHIQSENMTKLKEIKNKYVLDTIIEKR